MERVPGFDHTDDCPGGYASSLDARRAELNRWLQNYPIRRLPRNGDLRYRVEFQAVNRYQVLPQQIECYLTVPAARYEFLSPLDEYLLLARPQKFSGEWPWASGLVAQPLVGSPDFFPTHIDDAQGGDYPHRYQVFKLSEQFPARHVRQVWRRHPTANPVDELSGTDRVEFFGMRSGAAVARRLGYVVNPLRGGCGYGFAR